MKKRNLFLPAFLACAFFISCEYEKPNLLPVNHTPEETETPPTAQEFKSLHTAALNNLKQEFIFDAATTTTITSEKGVTLTINGGCLTKNGNPVTGDVKLEYVEIFNRGNMLTANRPTMGLLPNGDKSLLISGGEFYINATQGGVQLVPTCGFQLLVPASLTGGADNAMTLWNGLVDEEGNIVWDEEEQGEMGQEGGIYYCFLNHFGWTNVDRFSNDPRPKTTIYVDVPDGYDNENCAVYLSYNEEGNALARLDTYDDVTELFTEHYGQIPIGLECYVIFVSEGDGEWIYAIKAVTIVENGIITITDTELSSISEAALIAAIDALP